MKSGGAHQLVAGLSLPLAPADMNMPFLARRPQQRLYPRRYPYLLLVLAQMTLFVSCAQPETYQVGGVVSGSWSCLNAGSSRMPTIIRLLPLEDAVSFTQTKPGFSFAGVPDGDYSLQVSCAGFSGRYPPLPVRVSGSSLEVEVVLPFPTLPRSQPLLTIAAHAGPVLSLAFAGDGRTVVSAAEDGVMARWDAATGQDRGRHTFDLSGPARPVQLSADGRQLVAADDNGALILWDAMAGDQIATFRLPNGEVDGVAWTGDGAILAAWAAASGTPVNLWEAASGELLGRLVFNGEGAAPWWARRSAAFSPDGRSLASVEAQGREWIFTRWDVSGSAQQPERMLLPLAEASLVSVHGLTASPAGSHLALVAQGIEARGALYVIELSSGKGVAGWYETALAAIAFSPDGQRVASTAHDNTIVLWDVIGAAPLSILLRDDGGLGPLAWSPDGSLIAAGDGRGRITIWRAP